MVVFDTYFWPKAFGETSCFVDALTAIKKHCDKGGFKEAPNLILIPVHMEMHWFAIAFSKEDGQLFATVWNSRPMAEDQGTKLRWEISVAKEAFQER